MPLSVSSPQSWLQQRLSKSKFLVLFFYRGEWCPYCKNYLTDAMPAVEQLQSMGGEVLGICSQLEEDVKLAEENWKLNFPLVSDPKNSLAKENKIVVTKKTDPVYNKMIQVASFFKLPGLSQLTSSNKYEEGVGQPAVVVITKDTTLFKWLGAPKKKNFFGASDRIHPNDVLTITKFHLSPKLPYAPVSVLRVRESASRQEVFQFVFSNAELKKLFREFLKLEFNEEMIDFVEAVTELKQLLPKVEKKPKKLQQKVEELVDKFVKEEADREINIPGETRSAVVESLEGFKNEERSQEELLAALEGANLSVLVSLGMDSFGRFMCYPTFGQVVEAAPHLFTA